MEKIKSCLLTFGSLLFVTAAFSQASTDKDLFTKKVTYKLSGARNANIAKYKVEAFKNTIKIFCDGKFFSELGFSKPKPGPGTGPLPPGPNPCSPGRCLPLSFSLEDNVIIVAIDGKKTGMKVYEMRGKAFTDAINQSPGKQIMFSEAQF